MLVTLSPYGVTLALKIESGIRPESSGLVSADESNAAVLLETDNGSFDACLHCVVVRDHLLQDGVIVPAIIDYVLRDKLFGIVDEKITWLTACCNDILFEQLQRSATASCFKGVCSPVLCAFIKYQLEILIQRWKPAENASIGLIYAKFGVGRRMNGVCFKVLPSQKRCTRYIMKVAESDSLIEI